jgi:hypothetical protein
MRFSAGHQQRRLRCDGHHAMLPLIFDPTKDPHKHSSDPETKMTSFEIKLSLKYSETLRESERHTTK